MKNSGPKFKFNIGYIFIILFVLIYAPIFMSFMFSNNVNTGVLTNGPVSDSTTGEMIILRDESINYSNSIGVLDKNVFEGKRVSKGHIVSYSTMPMDGQDFEKIIDLNEKIRKQKMEINITTGEEERVRALNIALSLSKVESQNAVLDIGIFKDEADMLVKDTNNTLPKTTTVATKNMLKELYEITDRYIDQKKSIVSQNSGIVSFVIDGYEQQLNPLSHTQISYDYFKSILSNPLKVSSFDPLYEASVKTSKVIHNDFIYLATYLEGNFFLSLDKIYSKTSGQSNAVSIKVFGAKTPGRAEVVSLSKVGDRVFVVFKTNAFISETSGRRTTGGEIVMESSDGFVVPVNALVDYKKYGDTATIALIKSGKVAFLKVDVKTSDGDFVVIEKSGGDTSNIRLEQLDKYVTNPDKVKEGQVI